MLRQMTGRLIRRLLRWAWGATLVEVVVATAFAGLSSAAVAGMISVGVKGTRAVVDRTDAGLIARAQLEAVLSESYRPSGNYTLLSDIPPGLRITIDVQDMTPGLLQQINVKVLAVGETAATSDLLAEVSSLKANRQITTGQNPQAVGVEMVRPVTVPDLAARTGFYYVVRVIPSATRGVLEADWQLLVLGSLPATGERRDISITLFSGAPFGEGSGASSLAPESLPDATAIAQQTVTDDVVLRVRAKDVTAGTYTIYFYNKTAARTVVTEKATVSCICPP